MQMVGEQRVAAPRQRVWEALNDPAILRACIPGCEALEKEGADRFKATVAIKIGPIGARFEGEVALTDPDPPNGYTISGKGRGGTVGFAEGGAKVRLLDDKGGTLIRYEVDAQVGGRLAQLGGPIIDATAKQLAGKFFRQFDVVLGASGIAASGATPRPVAERSGYSMAWIPLLVFAALVGFLVGRAGADWLGLSVALFVALAALAGFEFGRRSASPVILLDPPLLAQLLDGTRQ